MVEPTTGPNTPMHSFRGCFAGCAGRWHCCRNRLRCTCCKAAPRRGCGACATGQHGSHHSAAAQATDQLQHRCSSLRVTTAQRVAGVDLENHRIAGLVAEGLTTEASVVELA